MDLLHILTPFFFMLVGLGTAIGIIFGAIPGMTATMAVAVCLPLTYALDLNQGLALLLGLYVGGISGGLVPAILLNIPGTPASIATTFDGYPMNMKGEGERALKIGIFSSLFGGLFSLIVLYLFAPAARRFRDQVLLYREVPDHPVRADRHRGAERKPADGVVQRRARHPAQPRRHLRDLARRQRRIPPDAALHAGLPRRRLLPAAGADRHLRAVDRLLGGGARHARRARAFPASSSDRASGSRCRCSRGRSSTSSAPPSIGTFVGLLPGVGGSAASILSYSQAKTFSKKPEEFGTGIPSGIIASESANNGLTGGALIPLLSLGIPGDSTTAVLIGAFTLQGIQVGPLFIGEHVQTWNTMIIATLAANIFMFLIMFFAIRYIAKVVTVPKYILFPIILIMCVVGAYTINYGVMFDVWTLLIFGLFGYFAPKVGIEVAPFIIGFILGPSAEIYFVKSLKSFGDLTIFFTKSWIAVVLWVLIAISLIFSLSTARAERRDRERRQ